MEFLRAVDESKIPEGERSRTGGIALMMVLAAVAVLSVLITEFTYVASINQKMAYDSLDLVKAHYLAKSAVKLSLLRLKAYQHVKQFISGAQGAGAAVPKGAVEKIWSFPFFYPLPTNVPGMTAGDKDAIEKFQKDTSLEGKFAAVIASESARYNINQSLQAFAPSANPSATPSGQPSSTPSTTPTPPPNPNPSAGPSASPSFNPADARKAMTDYFNQIIQNKIQDDDDFAQEHRDLRIDDIMDQIFAWSDRTYERQSPTDRDPVKFRKSPFNTVTELHMLPIMTDELYDVFAPTLTVSSTPGININTMDQQTLLVLVPGMTKDEATEFFKFRDSEEEDNLFKSPDDFYKYILNNVAVFHHAQAEVDRFKGTLEKQTRLVTDESQFKVTVTAQVNQSTELIEAWVTMGPGSPSSNQPTTPGLPGQPAAPKPSPTPSAQPGQPLDQNGQPKPDVGLKITFMRIL